MDMSLPVAPLSTLSAVGPQLKEQIRAYCQQLVQQSQESFTRLLRLQIILILHQIKDNKAAKEWIEYAIESLVDPLEEVRQAAVTALGQLGTSEPRVLDALLNALTDLDSDVHQALTNALTTLPVDTLIIGRRIEEILRRYEPIASKQVTADDVDSLLSTLQQILGEA